MLKWFRKDIGHSHLVFYCVVAIVTSILTTIVMEKVFFRYEALWSDE